MDFQRDCPYCTFQTTSTKLLVDMDREFEDHLALNHNDDGMYLHHLTIELGVVNALAVQTIETAVEKTQEALLRRQNPKQEVAGGNPPKQANL